MRQKTRHYLVAGEYNTDTGRPTIPTAVVLLPENTSDHDFIASPPGSWHYVVEAAVDHIESIFAEANEPTVVEAYLEAYDWQGPAIPAIYPR